MVSKNVQERLDRPAQNRSLERGIDILRAFRPGADLIGNSELAERTGLAPATVSRLTQTLVRTGMLDYEARERAYRLAAPLLSFGHAMRSASPVLKIAAPLMQRVAQAHKINVGIAVIDHDEMVYLESVRFNKKVSLRNVVAGQRVPIELTSLGRAYLASMAPQARDELMQRLHLRRHADWASLERQIRQSLRQVRKSGFCVASWQPNVIALATPLRFKYQPVHVLNVSVNTHLPAVDIVSKLSPVLMELAGAVLEAEN
ncbi:MAG: IclR family transcriptional regulator [Advenella sp.]|uniref:IclR family transcriptional regulator n=1 Tax=Advenella kashmirensis TaxID=310575 RepID=A0A356LJ84_9BURK|nr:IclR family transcriptional regulator [Advenella kashmirensis]